MQELVKKLQNFIAANYYTCTKDILAGLGQMYAAGGKGAAAFAAKAIAEYCR